MVKVEWKGERIFEGHTDSGNRLRMNAAPDTTNRDRLPTPAEAFLAAGAACSANHVLEILENMHQRVTAYWVEAECEHPHAGPYPRPYVTVVLRHCLQGENLDIRTCEHAIRLSDEKYCTEISTLRGSAEIDSILEVKGEEGLLL